MTPTSKTGAFMDCPGRIKQFSKERFLVHN